MKRKVVGGVSRRPFTVNPLIMRLNETRAILRKSSELHAPDEVITAICIWIGELEELAIKRGLDPYGN